MRLADEMITLNNNETDFTDQETMRRGESLACPNVSQHHAA